MTQLLATLVPAMFEAWNKVLTLIPPKRVFYVLLTSIFCRLKFLMFIARSSQRIPCALLTPRDNAFRSPPPLHFQATCRALLSMSASDKIVRMEAEVRTACDMVQKASAELECMRAREALKRRCAILNTRIESLQVPCCQCADFCGSGCLTRGAFRDPSVRLMSEHYLKGRK